LKTILGFWPKVNNQYSSQEEFEIFSGFFEFKAAKGEISCGAEALSKLMLRSKKKKQVF
jgi:hypothetical protein